ncbi:LysR family transcriptional regulator [Umezawaea tangerina]|uniref:DNA-binding transcriptional LysR family regulator n=1 Tax=Umezawaea tangerina TaxID=84725 RepID=A0A2T0T9K1_9PSEU|nr:LysR family transcriptional regulator [Umezawaea tangerina]PRY42330.1 DNA-binding transcriptional LysR family regulator [Umezawaea tangerina]
MLNPVHLRTVVEVVAAGSFAAAARNLGYTASAVSQQVSAFERAVGVELFERGAHSIRPAAAALFIAERGGELLAAFDGFEQEVQALVTGRRGRIRLGTFPTASARVVPHAVARLTHDRPDAEIRLDEAEPDDVLPLVLAGDLDVALVYAYDLVPRTWPDELTVLPLLDEALLVLLPDGHPAARHQTVRPDDLRDARWIASRDGTAGSTCLTRLCAANGFTPRITFRSNDYGVVHALVRAGVGVALVPALGYEPQDGTQARPLRGTVLRRHVSAVHRTANTNPLLRDALDAVVAACALVEGEHLTRA